MMNMKGQLGMRSIIGFVLAFLFYFVILVPVTKPYVDALMPNFTNDIPTTIVLQLFFFLIFIIVIFSLFSAAFPFKNEQNQVQYWRRPE